MVHRDAHLLVLVASRSELELLRNLGFSANFSNGNFLRETFGARLLSSLSCGSGLVVGVGQPQISSREDLKVAIACSLGKGEIWRQVWPEQPEELTRHGVEARGVGEAACWSEQLVGTRFFHRMPQDLTRGAGKMG